jgi:hypothetical protein
MNIKGKQTIFCILVLAQLFSTLTMAAQPLSSEPVTPSFIDHVFKNKEGIPYLLTHNGRRGLYRTLSSNGVEIEIQHDQFIGRVRMRRNGPDENTASMMGFVIEYESASGNTLSFGTSTTPTGQVNSLIKFNDSMVRFDPQQWQKKDGGETRLHENIRDLLTKAAIDPGLQRLSAEAQPFLSRSAIRKVFPTTLSEHQYVSDCAVEATDCLVSLVAYGISMSALYSSCGFSLGAGCIAALLAHPVMSGAVVIYCGRALQSCGITR